MLNKYCIFLSSWKKKATFFLFHICDVRQLISFSTLRVSLCHPADLYSLRWCVPQFSRLLLPPLCLLSSLSDCLLFPSLYLHLFFFFICHFPLISLPCLFPLFSLSSSFVSLSVFAFFSCILFIDIVFHLYLWIFPFVFCLTPSSRPRQVYFSVLLSVSKALEMNYWTDWPLAAQLLFGCGVCVFSLIPFQFFKCFWSCMSLSVFVLLSVCVNLVWVCVHFCAAFVC